MNLPTNHKNEVGAQLARRVGQALKDNQITMEDIPLMSDYVLAGMERVTTSSELIKFLENLHKRWPYFDNILTLEKAKTRQAQEAKKIEKVEDLIEEKKLDQAIQTAQSVGSSK